VLLVNDAIDIISENMAVLFDLDFTPIDSSPLIELRQTKQQYAAYQMIPQIQSYAGINIMVSRSMCIYSNHDNFATLT
jgi:hypothetical protein